MFEGVFNLKFNLNKAYTDIGLSDDDAALNARIYGLTAEEYGAAIAGFKINNQKNAEKVLAGYEAEFGVFHPDTETRYKIAYLGDSITSERESHQYIVREILKDYSNITFHDFSISGLKASDIFTGYYPSIADFAPDIAIMMIGTNDMRITDDEYGYYHSVIDEYSRNINYIIAKLAAAGAHVMVCTLPPFDLAKIQIALEGWHILYTEGGRKLYDEAIISAANSHSAILVDMQGIYADFDAKDLTIEDGIHLNGEGQTLLAMQIFQKLSKLIEIKG